MLMLDADTILDCMPFTTLVEQLAALHREPIGLPYSRPDEVDRRPER